MKIIVSILALSVLGANGAVIPFGTKELETASPHVVSLTDRYGGLDSESPHVIAYTTPEDHGVKLHFVKPKEGEPFFDLFEHAKPTEREADVLEEHVIELPKPKPTDSEHFVELPKPVEDEHLEELHKPTESEHFIELPKPIEDDHLVALPKPTESEHFIELPKPVEEEHLVELPKPTDSEHLIDLPKPEEGEHDHLVELPKPTDFEHLEEEASSTSVSSESDSKESKEKHPHHDHGHHHHLHHEILPVLESERVRERRATAELEHKKRLCPEHLRYKRWIFGWGSGGEEGKISMVPGSSFTKPEQVYTVTTTGQSGFQSTGRPVVPGPGNQYIRQTRMHLGSATKGHKEHEMTVDHEHHQLLKERMLNVGGYGSTIETTHGKHPMESEHDLEGEKRELGLMTGTGWTYGLGHHDESKLDHEEKHVIMKRHDLPHKLELEHHELELETEHHARTPRKVKCPRG